MTHPNRPIRAFHWKAFGRFLYPVIDLELKQKALDRTAPANTKPGRYTPPDKLLALLESL
jgi:hypothetical protein